MSGTLQKFSCETKGADRAEIFETHVCGPLCKKLGLETRRRQKKSDNCCSICLEPLGKFIKQGKKKLPCNHTFHKKCIDGWLNISNSCPLCRRDVV